MLLYNKLLFMTFGTTLVLLTKGTCLIIIRNKKFYYFKTVAWITCEISSPGNLFKTPSFERQRRKMIGEYCSNIVEVFICLFLKLYYM